MYERIQWAKGRIILVLVAFIALGCGSTLTYRDIQRDFNLAVQADNIQSLQPIPHHSLLYEGIIHDLTHDNYRFIRKELDPKLQSNAYTILAISQWRAGKLTEAKRTVDVAKADPSLEFAPRDRKLFEIMPYLVDEQDLMQRFRRGDNKVLKEDYYGTYENNFAFIVEKLKDATKVVPEDVPKQIVWYIHYQRWRVLNNWRIVINGIWDGNDADSGDSIESRKEARGSAKQKLGETALNEEIEFQIRMIPEDHALRRLAEFQKKL